MLKSVTLFALLTVFSALAFAGSWKGRLIDSACYDQHKSAATCDPTGATKSFALFVAEKAYMLDEAGNSKAAEALKSRADRSADPAKPASSQIMATVTGTQEGDSLKVETLEVQ